MVSLAEIVGNSRGILGWEAEMVINGPVSGTATTIYYRSMDKYQEPFTLPASWKGTLETQRHTADLTETTVTCRMGLYLATGIAQASTVKVSQLGHRKVWPAHPATTPLDPARAFAAYPSRLERASSVSHVLLGATFPACDLLTDYFPRCFPCVHRVSHAFEHLIVDPARTAGDSARGAWVGKVCTSGIGRLANS
jgi:hypothetical protein